MWAGLIKSLYTAVEDHFGSSYVHAEQRAALVVGAIKIIFAGVLLLVSVAYFGYSFSEDDLDEETLGLKHLGLELLASATGAIAAIGTVGHTLFMLLTKTMKQSDRIADEASSPNFRNKLGVSASFRIAA